MSRNLFAELRRRNVIRAAVLYVGAVWALTQGVAQLAPVIGAPEWAARWFLVAAALGFPFWIVFAWIYEFTPDGLKRENAIDPADSTARRTGRKFDVAIIGVLALAVVLLLTDRFVLRRGVNQETPEAVAAVPEKRVPDRSIAVLPFVDMSPAKDQEYFSDGISEELLNLLAKINQLHVAARTSSFSFKGKDIGIPEIARSLHVAHVLEGSVRKSGQQVRITAQLIRAADGYHVWSQTWDRTFDDIFKIQDEIAGKVVEQLEVTLLGAAPKARATDPQAYALWLQARQLVRQNTAEALAQSDDLLHQVLAIDPNFAPAWNRLSTNFSNKVLLGLLPAQEGYARAREAEEKALALDPGYAPAHSGLGWLDMSSDLAAAARHFERALALDPNDPVVLGESATFLTVLGRLDDALALQAAAMRHDPLNAAAFANLGNNQRYMGRFDAAAASFRTALNLSPGYLGAHANMGVVRLLTGDATGALAAFEQEPNEDARMTGLPLAYHALGRRAEADAALAALIAGHPETPSNIACVYAFRGEADPAFAWLDKAAASHDPGLPAIAAENLFANIRSDPRWLPFLRRIGLAPEQLAKIEFKVTLPAE